MWEIGSRIGVQRGWVDAAGYLALGPGSGGQSAARSRINLLGRTKRLHVRTPAANDA